MRKIILTESQAKLLLEEIDKNDSIQKLIFCEPSDIVFKGPISDGGIDLPILIPIVDGKQIGTDFLKISIEEIHPDGETYYQPHIEISPELRRLGIAYKIYLSLILKDYPICNISSIPEIKALWTKLANEPGIIIDDLVDENGNKIGLKAYCDSL